MSEFISRIGEKKFSIKFSDDSEVNLNGELIDFVVKKISPDLYVLRYRNKNFYCAVTDQQNSKFDLLINGNSIKVTCRTSLLDKAEELIRQKNEAHSYGMIINSPMPGLILKIKKKDGDYVERGETVMILEAMKMENEIRAPISGTLHFNSIKEGISIEKNVKLFEIK